MHMRTVVALLTIFFQLGCTEGPSIPQLDLGKTDVGPKADRGRPSFSVTATLVDAAKVPLEKCSVCVLENNQKTTSCTTSDSKGRFTISLPAETETGVIVEKQGVIAPGLSPLWSKSTTQMIELGGWMQVSEAQILAELTQVGVTPSASKGLIVVNAVEGASFALVPPAGQGPFYADSKGVPDPSLTQLSATGWGMVADLAPGTYEILVTPPSGRACSREVLGWPSSSNTVRVPVLAGFGTQIYVPCS